MSSRDHALSNALVRARARADDAMRKVPNLPQAQSSQRGEWVRS